MPVSLAQAKQTVPTGFPGSAPDGPAMPVTATLRCRSGPCTRLRHMASNLRANYAEFIDNRLRHIEDI